MDIWAKKKIGAEASQYADRHGGALMFGLFMAGCAFVSVWLALFWYVSPLAIGFSDWPDDPAQRELFSRLYDLSWHAGIPLLQMSQPAAWALPTSVTDPHPGMYGTRRRLQTSATSGLKSGPTMKLAPS